MNACTPADPGAAHMTSFFSVLAVKWSVGKHDDSLHQHGGGSEGTSAAERIIQLNQARYRDIALLFILKI